MEWQELLTLEFEGLSRAVKTAAEGLAVEDLDWQPKPDSNSIGWLIWHLTRWQDTQISGFMKREQLWISDDWHTRFERPADAGDSGMGHKAEDLARFKSPDGETLVGYNRAVLARIKEYFSTLTPEDLDKTIEGTPFNPPPKVGMGIAGLVSDGMQHAGQAGYVRGLRQGMGWH